MNIGFIGLGVMGQPIAQNLLKSGHYSLTVYDIEAGRASDLVDQGARQASSISEAVTSADIVMTSLPGPKQIEQVAFGEEGIFDSIEEESTWIDLSTNNLELCRRIAQKAADKNIVFLDAPVSGGDEGALAGSLAILVGGASAVFKEYLPVLQVIGNRITHLGPTGAGYSAKIAQVVLCYLHSLALSEALMLGVSGGVDAAKMLDIIQNSTGRSYVADRYGPPILNGDYDPSFTVGLAHKDMKLAQEMANELGIKLPMCDLTTETYAKAIDAYGFEANHLRAVRLLEEENNTFLRGTL